MNYINYYDYYTYLHLIRFTHTHTHTHTHVHAHACVHACVRVFTFHIVTIITGLIMTTYDHIH